MGRLPQKTDMHEWLIQDICKYMNFINHKMYTFIVRLNYMTILESFGVIFFFKPIWNQQYKEYISNSF